MPVWDVGDEALSELGILVTRIDNAQPFEVTKDPRRDVHRDYFTICTGASTNDEFVERIGTTPPSRALNKSRRGWSGK